MLFPRSITSILLLSAGCAALPGTPALRSRPMPALPPMFEENRGQFSNGTKFLTRRDGYAVSFEAGVARIVTGSATPVRLLFAPALEPAGAERLAAQLNYFRGNDPDRWVRGAHAYRKVIYESPGRTSLAFYWNTAGDLEFDLTVPPGQDTAGISLRLRDATSVRLSAGGDLLIGAGTATLTLHKPLVYQMAHGSRRPVPCNYVLGDDGLVAFDLGDYDHHLPVIIDPTLTVTAGTYLGGSGGDTGRAVAVDSSGNTYIAGDTFSSDFPVSNALQSMLNGPQDAFIAKLNATGSAVIFATYLGGSMGDIANGIGLDSSGNIYVAGTTHSSDFPLKNPAIGTFRAAGSNAMGFVAKLNPAGSALQYSTYLGGSTAEAIDALAADSTGNAYVTGGTSSVDFPVLNGYQTVSQNPAGFNQPFLTKLSTNGTIVYSTITNAFGSDGAAVATDNNGVAVFASSTALSGAPTQNAYQPALSGGIDGYVVKVDTKQTGASSLLFATFLGGSNNDAPKGIALDSSGDVYVAGTTQSGNFPLRNALQSAPGNSFVTKIASNGSSLIFSTYLGGVGTNLFSIATDASGSVYATGLDFGANSPFPLLNPLPGQSQPAFVSAISSSGSLIYSTYVGTSGMSPRAITAAAGGDVTMTGQASAGVPTTPNAVQPTANGANAFLLRLSFSTPAGLNLSSVTPVQGGDSGFTTVTVRGMNIQAGATLSLKSPASSLTAFSTTVSVDSRGIAGTFDLRHQPDGPYDVVVTNPDSTTATLSKAFTVTLGGAPQLSVTVLGTNASTQWDVLLRVGGVRTETIIVSNDGTADAFAVPVEVEVGPGVTAQLLNTIITPAQNPNLPAIDYSQVPVTYTNGTTYIPLLIPWIPAGGTSYFRVNLTSPQATRPGATVPMTVRLANPALIPDPNGSQITGTVVKHSLSPSFALRPEITLAQLSALILSPDGKVCLLNILQLALQILKINPAINCAEDLLQQILGRTLQQEVFLALQGAAQNNSLSLGDVESSGAQTDVAVLQVVLDCTGVSTPVRTVVAAIGAALQLYSTFDSCTKAIAPLVIGFVTAIDPNEKDGPRGAGSQQWISGTVPAPYSISFENQATATAPAGQVVITDQLNPQLYNLSQFTLGPIAFGTMTVTPTPGSTSYSTKVDLRPAKNTIVSINAGISNTGLITWTFQSLDPITMQPVQDPSLGFLPPNTSPPQGQGYVIFSAPLNAALSTGTAIPNQASVVFDNNPAILTNVWQNTIDATPPTSRATTLPSNQPSNVFSVNWSGNDIGSGVHTFTVFNSVNGGPFTPWISGTTATSASCVAKPNSTQAFFTIATDAAGNVETGKFAAETSTQVANVEAVTITTNPPGLLVSVDNGTPQTAPVNAVWQVGSQHTIATLATQGSSGTQYTFSGWSDNGALSHTVTTTVGIASYTANFNTSYLLSTSANPAQGGTIAVNPPGTNGYYAAGTQVNLTAVPNSGYTFSSWTGNVANNASSATTINMTQPQAVVANFTATSGAPSLGSSITSKTGPSNARVWNIALNNGGTAAALATQLTAFHLTQSFGAACTPVVGTALPLFVGDIAAGTTGNAPVTVDFSSCPANARFTVNYSYSSTNLATASKTFHNQFQ